MRNWIWMGVGLLGLLGIVSGPGVSLASSAKSSHAKKSTSHAKKPVSHEKKSASQAKVPVSHAKKPDAHAKKPVSHAKKPVTHAKKPVTHAKKPVSHAALEKKSAAHGGGGARWSYSGRGGPENWGRISSKNAVCGAGKQQSPINLNKHASVIQSKFSMHWKPASVALVDNGHTIQGNVAPGSYIMLDGARYDLLQFHFHHPSEHTAGNRPYLMESHFVHKAADGRLAVVGVFITQGASHGEFAKIFKRFGKTSGKPTRIGPKVELQMLLPENRAMYRYAGSLTTPPCSEVVSWLIFRDPVSVSGGQIAEFARKYPANARPVQAMNRRFILGNF